MLSRTQKQLCEVILAEDIVDRLVQGHVISGADRQEVMTPGKNLDRMQILMSKVAVVVVVVVGGGGGGDGGGW